MATVQVRYIVHNVDAAIAFYTETLDFKLEMHPAPPFAMLSRGDLRLVLSAPNPGRWRRSADDRWHQTGTGRVESLWDRSNRSSGVSRNAPRSRSALSKRHRHRGRRQADHSLRPLWKSDRTVRATTCRSSAWIGSTGLRIECPQRVLSTTESNTAFGSSAEARRTAKKEFPFLRSGRQTPLVRFALSNGSRTSCQILRLSACGNRCVTAVEFHRGRPALANPSMILATSERLNGSRAKCSAARILD